MEFRSSSTRLCNRASPSASVRSSAPPHCPLHVGLNGVYTVALLLLPDAGNNSSGIGAALVTSNCDFAVLSCYRDSQTIERLTAQPCSVDRHRINRKVGSGKQ